MAKDQSGKNSIMEGLLASLANQSLSFSKGQEIEGTVIFKLKNEIVLDLGSKSEGILSIQNLPEASRDSIKVGDKLVCIVIDPENESGQVILSLNKGQSTSTQKRFGDFDKLIQKYQKGEIYKGKIVKINQIGAFIELESGLEGLIRAQSLKPEDNLSVGQEISVNLDEIDLVKQRIALSPVLTSTKGLIYK